MSQGGGPEAWGSLENQKPRRGIKQIKIRKRKNSIHIRAWEGRDPPRAKSWGRVLISSKDAENRHNQGG